ncbi:MAG: ABC-F family ATP-binding cassette domain-containing protein [Dactylosporangium sp.]|nr:ABC-F family ATP-binding cassette domain-containing protein [Dactylosporangium sp.]NNJ60279.1 ABC-F family ATP-binding cassette domain-containing protein [Dactylosporangium sp.]
MANIVNLDRVGKAYAAGPIFEDVSVGIDDADRIGVVGLNGAGKTTLLRLLTRTLEPDEGRVTHRRELRVAALPQTLDLPATAVIREVVLGDAWLPAAFAAEHEWAGDAGIRQVLDGLGLPHLAEETPVGSMSGGERRRVALAALLVRQTDLLVLDEPTNHLDVAGIDWLAGHLRSRRGALIVVTHDRWFLDAVCTRTWEVADASVRAYDGGYAAWTLARAERDRVAAGVEARRQNLLRKEIAWLRRGPPARTTKPRFRIEAANAIIADVPPVRDGVSLRRLATARLGKQVYELDSATMCAGERTLLDAVTARIGPGDRVAILGANGAGKTTLLRALLGERRVDGGAVRQGTTVRPAYLSQEVHELPEDLRVLEAIEEVAQTARLGTDRPGVPGGAARLRPAGQEVSASQLAEMFGFAGGRAWTPVGDLSGGERRRLQLLRLLATEPNVLLLDEPTNDLDVDTLTALEDLLDTWPGTVIVASHDRYLVERVCDATLALLGGQLLHLPGGVDEYLARVAETRPSGSAAASPSSGRQKGPGQPTRAAVDRRLGKDMVRLERQIEKLTRAEARLHQQLADNATDYERVAALDGELRAATEERLAAEDSWLELAQRAEG